MKSPADFHPALGGKSLDDWLHTQIPDRAPAGRELPGWLRSLIGRGSWFVQFQYEMKVQLHARNQAQIASLEGRADDVRHPRQQEEASCP